MLEVWIMRHGEAVDPEQAASDFERQLTMNGRRQVAALSAWLKGHSPAPERILHSPLVRARQTAREFAQASGLAERVEEADCLAPGMSAERLLQVLSRRTDARVLCIGHQPDIGRCVSEMIGGGRFDISPGFCAAVLFQAAVLPGAGKLLWAATPDWFS